MSAITLSVSDLNTEVNHEPRLLDLTVAKSLGYERPRVIRELIERNRAEIETYGSLAVRHGKSRGQSFTEYFLNEGQALVVCALSRTPKAAIGRKAIIDVYMAFRAGRLQPIEPPADFTYKTISVKAHTRRLHRHDDRQLQLPAPLNRDGLGVLMVNGKAVMFDANNQGNPGDTVVFWYSGRVAVGVRHEDASYAGRALIPYKNGDLPSLATGGRMDAPVIGRVVERRSMI